MDQNIQIRKAQVGDLEEIAAFIVKNNHIQERHCIHCHTAEDAFQICEEIRQLYQAAEICFVVAIRDGTIVGIFGCEFDIEKGRGWLRGPLILNDIWELTANDLYQNLLKILPSSIVRLDSFLNAANTRGHNFYLSHKFRERGKVHTYIALSCPPAPINGITKLEKKQQTSFKKLHDSLFPDTYYTGKELVDKINDKRQVFVFAKENEVYGYVYATIDSNGKGEIEFLGVQAQQRGKKIGKQLLLAAMWWLFKTHKAAEIGLVVNDQLANARSLYESVGFKLEYTGINNRKEKSI